MKRWNLSALAAALLLSAPAYADQAEWTIWFDSGWTDCNHAGLPIVAPWAPCAVSGVSVSICPDPKGPPEPWNQGQSIMITSIQIAQLLSQPTAQGWLIIGSGHANDGADVFGETAGVGSHKHEHTFQAGGVIPQGRIASNPGFAHLDLYGECWGGNDPTSLQQRAQAIIHYKVAPASGGPSGPSPGT